MVQFLRTGTHLPQIRVKENPLDSHPIIWHHTCTGEYLIKTTPIERLSPIQRRLLSFLLRNEGVYLTKTRIINGAWPDGTARSGVSDDALFQQISALRKLLRNYSSHTFIVTWRGIPEGGYRFMNHSFTNLGKLHNNQIIE